MHAHARAVLHCWEHARAHVRAHCLSLSRSLSLSLTHETLTHELSLSLSLRERERERERESDRERTTCNSCHHRYQSDKLVGGQSRSHASKKSQFLVSESLSLTLALFCSGSLALFISFSLSLWKATHFIHHHQPPSLLSQGLARATVTHTDRLWHVSDNSPYFHGLSRSRVAAASSDSAASPSRLPMHQLPLLPPPPPPPPPLPTHEPSRGDIPRPSSFLIVAGIRQGLRRVYLVRLNPVRRQHSTLHAPAPPTTPV
jgi:hypothetical protein